MTLSQPGLIRAGSGLNLHEHPVGILELKGSVQPALPGNRQGLVSTIFAQIFDKRGVVNRKGFVNPPRAITSIAIGFNDSSHMLQIYFFLTIVFCGAWGLKMPKIGIFRI